MADTGDYCPLSRAADVFATRWTPVIVRNLLLGCSTFTEIREHAPGLSRQVLSERLRMLEHHALIERHPRPDGTVMYVLTDAGEALRPVCDALGMWGQRWIELVPAEVDAASVLRMLVKTLMPSDMPQARTVIRFELAGPRPRRYWLLLDPPGAAEVCKRPPGPEDDLVVSTTSEWLTRWHTGLVPSVGGAMRAGTVAFDGPLDLARRVAEWGGRGVYDHPVLASMAGAAAAR
jgi:DNA-binding HxlR family transcriptional regulator